MSDNKKFNQTKYVNQYHKEHYKKFQTNVKPELEDRINKYCADFGISKAEFLKRAIDALDKLGDNKLL